MDYDSKSMTIVISLAIVMFLILISACAVFVAVWGLINSGVI